MIAEIYELHNCFAEAYHEIFLFSSISGSTSLRFFMADFNVCPALDYRHDLWFSMFLGDLVFFLPCNILKLALISLWVTLTFVQRLITYAIFDFRCSWTILFSFYLAKHWNQLWLPEGETDYFAWNFATILRDLYFSLFQGWYLVILK